MNRLIDAIKALDLQQTALLRNGTSREGIRLEEPLAWLHAWSGMLNVSVHTQHNKMEQKKVKGNLI